MGEISSNRILVLDCDPESRKTIKFLLRLAGYEVAVATNIPEAINDLFHRRETSHQYGLFLVNNGVAKMSVLEMLAEFERMKILLPVLIVERSKEMVGIDRIVSQSGTSFPLISCRPENVSEYVSELL